MQSSLLGLVLMKEMVMGFTQLLYLCRQCVSFIQKIDMKFMFTIDEICAPLPLVLQRSFQ